MLIAIGLATIASFFFNRPAVYAIFCLAFVEGYLRNLFDSPSILLAKDFMLAAVCLRVLAKHAMASDSRLEAGPIGVPLAVFAGVVIVQSFNPHIVSPLEALIGLRTWLFYVLLYFVGRDLITTGSQAWRFAGFVIASATVISAIAIVQWVSGPLVFAKQGRAFADATFVVAAGSSDEVFRPNATFAWPSHFALFLAMATLVCLGSVLASRQALRLLLIGVLAFLLMVNVIESQRLIYIVLPAVIGIVLWTRGAVPRGRALLATGVIVLTLITGLVLLDSVGHDPLLRTRQLVTDPASIFGDRWEGYLIYVREAITVSPIGLGSGATALGSRYVLSSVPLFVENPLAKVIGDLSLAGLLAYAWLFVRLIVSTIRRLRAAAASRSLSAADFMAAVLGCQLLSLFTGYDIAVGAMLLWFLSGSVSHAWQGKPS
jgi:hypothetical protein